MFYGTMGEVGKRTGILLRELQRGKDVRALDFGPMMSTSDDRKARIVLRWSRPLSEPPQFQAYSFFTKVIEAASRDKLDEAKLVECFAWSLEAPWRFLGIADQGGGLFLYPEKRWIWRRPFLEAALRYWDVLEGEGRRYGVSSFILNTFSMTPTSLFPALAQEGLPMDPNPVNTPGRTYELLCAAVQKFKTAPPWPPS
jgi:hypothetical protein